MGIEGVVGVGLLLYFYYYTICLFYTVIFVHARLAVARINPHLIVINTTTTTTTLVFLLLKTRQVARIVFEDDRAVREFFLNKK
jgi:hypothetical protein